MTPRAGRKRALLAGCLAGVVAVGLIRSVDDLVIQLLGVAVLQAVALPLALLVFRPALRRTALGLVVCIAVLPFVGQVIKCTVDLAGSMGAAHDGGVVVTQLAAEDVLAGRNPYAEDQTAELPAAYRQLRVVDSPDITNPVTTVYPYLPGAFLIAVPGVLVDVALGIGGDPRWFMGAAYLAMMGIVLCRPEPRWARAATILAMGTLLGSFYMAWGTNDMLAGGGVVVAALIAHRRPRLAAAVLAVAISLKFLVAVAVVPFAVHVIQNRGWSGLRPWWPLPAILTLTVAPFLVADPGALLHDTVLYWAGASDVSFPASGYGLPVRAGGVFAGPLLVVSTVVLGLGGLAGAVALARVVEHPGILPLGTAVAVLGVVLPARTFQGNYLALMVVMAATGWLVVGARAPLAWPAKPKASQQEPLAAG